MRQHEAAAPRHPATRWWTGAAAAAVLTATFWLREPTVPYLVAAAAATVTVAVLALVGPPGGRRWRVALALASAAFCGLALEPQRALWRVEQRWPAYEGRALASAAAVLDRALGSAATELALAARAALDAVPAGQADKPLPLTPGREERAIVVLEGDRAVAWAGMLRVPPEAAPPGLGVVRTPFYDALTYTEPRGPRRAIATFLLDTRPPADALAWSLAAEVADHTPAPGLAFVLAGPGAAPPADAALRLDDGRWLVARLDPLVRGEVEFRLVERARTRGIFLLAVMAVCLLASVWGPTEGLRQRLAALAVLLAAGAVVPLNTLSNASALFDPSYYFAALGGPFTASIGALLMTSTLTLLALLATLRARVRVPSRWVAALLVLLVAGLGPFLLRHLARGIAAPARGGSTALWLAWHVALFVAATVVLLLGASAGRAALGRWRGLPPLLAPAVGALAALLAQPLLGGDGRWPDWYPALWIVAIAALALTRRTRSLVLAAAAVASLGAMTLVWGSSVRWRMALAERDVEGLTRVDPVIETLLDRLAADLRAGPLPATRAELLAAFAASDLAAADQAVQLTTWTAGGARLAEVTDVGGEALAEVRALADSARRTGEPLRAPIATPRGVRLAIAVPGASGRVTTVAVAQRTRLLADDPYAALLMGAPAAAAGTPYVLTLVPDVATPAPGAARAGVRWTRHGDALHGDAVRDLAGRATPVHVELELRSSEALLQRGTLLLLLDLLVVGTLWMLNALAERGMPRWMRVRRRRWARSYRVRLSVALFAFFVVPAALFGIWMSQQLQAQVRQARELLVFETLRGARAVPMGDAVGALDRSGAGGTLGPALDASADVPLLLYRGGLLAGASDELFATLAPLGRLLPPDVAFDVSGSGHPATSELVPVGAAQVLVGYRVMPASGPRTVLAVPARADELGLDARRRDLGVLVLFVTALGALAALWLSGIAARQLARPIGALRGAALAIAGGEREPPLAGPEPPAEFVPVFSAFRRMAADLSASRSALEEAERRLAAVLRNAASAVIAVDAHRTVTLYNPAAERLFGPTLAAGAPLRALGVPQLEERVARLAGAVAAGEAEEEVELELGQRQVHARVAPLHHGGGAVLTLDDVTELARAQRVLAWGEMARQVAHEIKNPLTPIRLGVQHLRRAYHAGRGDYERVLDQNVERILAEIDRLDEIARAFSRYGTAPDARRAGRPTDVSAVARDVVELERMGAVDGAVRWCLDGADEPRHAVAQDEELREVLLNVLENARLAGAREVRVALRGGLPGDTALHVDVRDDGGGIAPEVLARVFEPHFSTRTSGSGLGLAISRRLVEGWGGTITLESTPGAGTEVHITLAAAHE